MTARVLLEAGRGFLERAGVPEARVNAEHLLAHALGIPRTRLWLSGEARPAEDARRRFLRLLRRRARRVPLAYLMGSQPFLGLELEVTPAVLIPRPETEEVAEAAIALARRDCARTVLDAGTGSGCIALALARALPEAVVLGIDSSPGALAVARRNARRRSLQRRVRFMRQDFVSGPARHSGLDLVVSNPPYIPSSRLPELQPEVLQEPRPALDGGPDGLRAVRALLRRAPAWLKPGGRLVLEIDHGQGRRVRELMRRAGFEGVEIRRDLQGLERMAVAGLSSIRRN